MRHRIHSYLATAALLALASSCTRAPATIDRVQPNAVAKSALDGEWFWRNTVADVPYGSAATFTGAQTDMERIRWDIQEGYLFGYRSYPNVDDTDADVWAGPDGAEYYGAPLLAFAIEKHFDIRRAYDPSTGEESNVVEENTEADWDERDYMRVNWGTNHADVSWSYAGVELKALEYFDEDPDDADAPRFDDTDGDGAFDSVNLWTRVLAQPDTEYIPGYGDIPSCYFYGASNYECDATEVTINSSFVRVDAAREYVGAAYDDRWMETFGVFQTMRLEYDRRYGLTEAGRVWYANKHNLWTDWIARDDAGEPLCAIGEDDDASQAPCAELSADESPRLVEIPYADRGVRQIVYHLNADFPDDLRDLTADLVDEWNAPFRDAVNGMRFWECADAGGSAESCESVVDPDLTVLVLCENNPSIDGDPAVCSTDHGGGADGGPDGIPDEARIGDLRYNLLYYVEDPQISSPYGYGPSAADPYGASVPLADGALPLGAGEIISANAFVYGHVLDQVATTTADLVELMNGGISTDAFVEGSNVTDWVDALNEGGGATSALAGRSAGAPDGAYSQADVEALLARMDTSWADGLREQIGRPDDPAALMDWLAFAEDLLQDEGVFLPGEAAASWDAMSASGFTDPLWDAEAVGVWGYDPDEDADLSGSPLDLIAPGRFNELEESWVRAGQHAVDLLPDGYTDPSLVGVAQAYADAGLDYESIWTDVRRKSFSEVTLHELGHNFGLRHNFAGSYDAFNFHPEYWDIRDDGHIGPRHIDPETDAEREAGIREYQYSAVMDYLGARNGAWHGLGRHDEAAVKFIYGQLVEVMTEVPTESAVYGLPNDDALGYISLFNTFNTLPGVVLTYNTGENLGLHYTQYPAIAGDLEARVDVPLSRMKSAYYDAVGTEGAWTDFLVVKKPLSGVTTRGMPAAPYRFCSDEFATGMTCDRRDEGADMYEIQRTTMDRYWNNYVMNNFRRGRYGFQTSSSYLNSIYNRYFDPLRTFQVYYALYHGTFGAADDPAAAEFFVDPHGFGGWTAASAEAFQFLVQVMLRPEPGDFSMVTDVEGGEYYAPVWGDGELELPLVTGAWYSSEWASDAGYHWFDQQTIIGSYWDKMMALEVLSITEPYSFQGVDTAVDPRTYGVGFQDLWGEPMALMLAQIGAGEVTSYAPYLDGDELVYRDFTDLTAAWPPPGAEVVQPAAYWSIQYSAGLFGKALLNRGYDNSFINRARIHLDGSGEALNAPEGTEEIRFEDPFSGKTYVAWSFPATEGWDDEPLLDERGRTIELGSGAVMLERANRLKALCELETIAPYTDAGDDDSLAAQQDLACAELEVFAGDVQLQYEIFQYYGG